MEWPIWYKWVLTQLVAVATLAVAFVSSAYTGGLERVIVQFGVSQEVVTLGVSLFVLGFALGYVEDCPGLPKKMLQAGC